MPAPNIGAKLQAFARLRIVNRLSIPAALALGPITLFLGYKMNLVFGVAAWYFFLVSLTAIPVVIALAGPFRFLVWQLAALSLAVSIAVDDLRLEAAPLSHLREYAGVGLVIWAIATILSSGLPIIFLVQKLRARKPQPL
jgi:hypothetical protein